MEAGSPAPSHSIMKCRYVNILQAPVCFIGHQNAFRSEQDLKRHLVQTHAKDLLTEEVASIMVECHAQKNCAEKLNESEKKLCNAYWKYYGGDVLRADGKYANEVLPILPMFSVTRQKQCTKCLFIISNEQKWNTHKKGCGSELRDGFAQSLKGGNAVKYFRVDGSDKLSAEDWVLNGILKMLNERKGDEEVSKLREMGALMSQLRCDDHLVHFGLCVETAWKLVRWDDGEERGRLEQNVFKGVQSYVRKAMLLNKRNVFVKTHSFMGQKIHLALGENTITEYNRKVTKLLYFLLNIHKRGVIDGENDIMEVLSVDQKEMVSQIVEHLEISSHSEVSVALHRLMLTLFLSTASENIQAIPLFTACCCVIRDDQDSGLYHYGSGVDISPILAALLHFAQCIVVHEVYGNIRPNEQQFGFLLTRDGNMRWAELETLEQRREDCGAKYIRYCMDLCNTIRKSEMAHIRFVVCQNHAQCALLDGKELSLKSIGYAVKHQQQLMRECFAEHLLIGFENHLHAGFWEEVKGFVDNSNNRSEGFWFGTHRSNLKSMEKWLAKYTNHMVQNGLSNADKSLNQLKCVEFVKHSEVFVEKLFWLLQVTGGGPARGTELMSIQYRNGRHSNRNIYLQQGRIMYVILAHKGRAKSGGIGKPIARFPDVETSRLIYLYLMFVRPLEDFICLTKHNDNRDRQQDAAHVEPWCSNPNLFSIRGITLSERRVQQMFSSIMKEECGECWRISEYRQFHSGIVKNFVSPSGNMEIGSGFEMISSLHEQSGHATETANQNYGVSELDMKNLDSVQLEVWRRASFKWHDMIEVGGSEESGKKKQDSFLEAKNACTNESSDNHSSQRVTTEVLPVLQRLEGHLNIILSYIKKSPNEEYAAISTRKRSYDEMERCTGLVTETTVLKALRKTVGSEEAMFRNEIQEKALVASCKADGDMLFVLPTGSGKSLLFMIQPFMFPNSVCIVIVPLVSLQQDLVRKCTEAGICGVLWKDRHMAGASLVFCSCEHVTKGPYASYVKEMMANGKLLAIFVDEAHLIRQWSDFRQVLGRMKDFIRPNGCDINVLALTGTCPPRMESTLTSMGGLRSAQVIRQECVRKNISYRVLSCAKDNVMYELIRIIGGLVTNNVNAVNSCLFKRMIVYCLKRKECESFVKSVRMVFNSQAKIFKYHAGMGKVDRREESNGWGANEDRNSLKIMFATAAFGCGIDMPDVRMVIHIGKPRTIIGYLQESGRAGRDGNPAQSIVLNIEKEEKELQSEMEEEYLNEEEQEEDNAETTEKCELVGSTSFELFSSQVEDSSMCIFGSLKKWVELGPDCCRRWILDQYLDGKHTGEKCTERGLAMCDLCENRPRNDAHMKQLKENHNSSEKRKSFSSNIKAGQPQSRTPSMEQSINGVIPFNHPIQTPPVSRRITFSSTEIQALEDGSSSCEQLSQSQTVSVSDIKDMASYFEKLCALCSVRLRKEHRHSDGHALDDQACDIYRKHCFRCASKNHTSESCFTIDFRLLKSRCYSCSLSTHANSVIHDRSTYGTRHCPNRNCIRFMTSVFEDEELRTLFNAIFPQVKNMQSNKELVEWTRQTDDQGHTWYADVLRWIKSEVIQRV